MSMESSGLVEDCSSSRNYYFRNVGFGFQEVTLVHLWRDMRRANGLSHFSNGGTAKLGRSSMEIFHLQWECITNLLCFLTQPCKFHPIEVLLLRKQGQFRTDGRVDSIKEHGHYGCFVVDISAS